MTVNRYYRHTETPDVNQVGQGVWKKLFVEIQHVEHIVKTV